MTGSELKRCQLTEKHNILVSDLVWQRLRPSTRRRRHRPLPHPTVLSDAAPHSSHSLSQCRIPADEASLLPHVTAA